MKNGQNYLGFGKDCRESFTGVIFRKEGRWLGESSINLPMTNCLADPVPSAIGGLVLWGNKAVHILCLSISRAVAPSLMAPPLETNWADRDPGQIPGWVKELPGWQA